MLKIRSSRLFPPGLDFGRLACPGNELDYKAGEREERADLSSGIGQRLQLLQHGCERIRRDQLKGRHFLGMAISQPQEDLLPHNRHERSAALDPLSLEGGWRQRRKCIATAAAELGPVIDKEPGNLARLHAALQAKQRHPKLDQMIKPVANPIAASAATLFPGKRHAQLAEVTQLIEQQL